jgi:hypothetical protein
MGSKNDKIIKLEAKKYNKKRKKLLPEGIKCDLLEKVGFTDTYNSIFTVENWWHTYDNYRMQTVVRVATQDINFEAALGRASDIRVGTTIFEISKRDTRPPDGNRPYWEVRAIIDIEER